MRVLLIPELYRPADPSANGTLGDAVTWVGGWLDRDDFQGGTEMASAVLSDGIRFKAGIDARRLREHATDSLAIRRRPTPFAFESSSSADDETCFSLDTQRHR